MDARVHHRAGAAPAHSHDGRWGPVGARQGDPFGESAVRAAARPPVRSCYEAGRDGFWLHRWLLAHEVENVVVDASSIEVNRRARRAKTDRLDTSKLLALLLRWHGGERHVWSVVHVPSPEAEAHRQVTREIATVREDRKCVRNRIQAGAGDARHPA